MTNLNGKQFRQQRLFAPLGMTKKPHQQTPLEFANSPRTMWHGSGDHEDFEDIRNQSDQFSESGSGFHVGTLNAAHDRLGDKGHYMNETQGYLHPVRVDERSMLNRRDDPTNGGYDDEEYGSLGVDMGVEWPDAAKPQYYVNNFEDKGSVSAVLETPYEVRHHADYVHEALDRGGIPSGAAEYFATRLDTEHSQYSPGFPRAQFAAEHDEKDPHGYGPRRLRAREDTTLSPVTKAHQSLGFPWSTQPGMLREVDTYNAEGERVGKSYAPEMMAVPPENRAMVEAQDTARKQPWLDRFDRDRPKASEVLRRRVEGEA